MKTITLDEAVSALKACAAIIWDDMRIPTFPHLADLTGEDDNEFLYVVVTDDEGRDFCFKCMEGNNRVIKVDGGTMYLEDTEGEEAVITLLEPMER